MTEYSELVKEFYEQYEKPTVDEYVVGFSGIDPPRKIIPSEIPHDELGGILGGGVDGSYHLTSEQLATVKSIPSKLSQLQSSIDAISGGSSTPVPVNNTEIIDARKDAENVTHTSLGANIRSIHEKIISQQSIITNLTTRIATLENYGGSSGGGEVSPIALTRERNDRLEHEEYLQEQIHDLARSVLLLTGEIDRLHYHSSNSGTSGGEGTKPDTGTTDTTEIEEIIKGILDETIDGETSGDDVDNVIDGILNDKPQTDNDDDDSWFYDQINDILNS